MRTKYDLMLPFANRQYEVFTYRMHGPNEICVTPTVVMHVFKEATDGDLHDFGRRKLTPQDTSRHLKTGIYDVEKRPDLIFGLIHNIVILLSMNAEGSKHVQFAMLCKWHAGLWLPYLRRNTFPRV